ncbi:methionine synthase [Clostridium aestuarii]|uniref:Methionine synthase n=1 Tax=Clostridium aestuarii TaxID=338193 RepID=A0ABT4D300_9CLOT|nr:vitamin B12 dependent-methionine synthase activation domain-containing protein [Clostridium aestuarii]MCY6485032.1 methionine synthase [Clostridium aestuarii]
MYIDKKEVLRYLGHKNQIIQEQLNLLIDQCIEEVKQYTKPKYTFGVFDIKKNDEGVELLESNLIFKGKDIKEHLKNSDMCAVMAVTLGSLVDSKIRYYEKFNLTKAVIWDSCASVLIEKICDEAECEIRKIAKNIDLGITYRYSPGYGDFPIDIQEKILNTLQAQKNIGLTATENSILIPRKSVTAVIGFQDKSITSEHPGCTVCSNYETCEYRRGGDYCVN